MVEEEEEEEDSADCKLQNKEGEEEEEEEEEEKKKKKNGADCKLYQIPHYSNLKFKFYSAQFEWELAHLKRYPSFY